LKNRNSASFRKTIERDKVVIQKSGGGWVMAGEYWVSGTLGDVAEIKTGKFDSNAAVLSGQFPFFTCSAETLIIERESRTLAALRDTLLPKLLSGELSVASFIS